MKKTLLTFSVFLAVICCTLAYAANRQGSSVLSVFPTAQVASEEANASNVGMSIGTVDAQLYSESGLTLNYFGEAEYVAQISENTYMGFRLESDWEYDEETGEEIPYETVEFVAINSSEESVTIPDSIRIDEEVKPIRRIYSNRNLRNGFSANIKNLTVPATITSISINYSFDQYLEAMYMLGSAPEIWNNVNVKTIYVCNQAFLGEYLNNKYYTHASILPYGWDFDWITVNVEKPGEFAETYLTQNDYNWNTAQYVKVTGSINDIDLSAIKNLTTLMKLDLSETSITSLPENFMYNRTSLVEVRLPSTLNSIGNSAFYGCTSLNTFDLNGITTIGADVFNGCASMSFINLKGVQTIGSGAFANCTKLNNVDLSTVQYIGHEAFKGCTSIQSVDLTSIIAIGYLPSEEGGYSRGRTFYDCSSLSSVTFGDGLLLIGYGSFSNTAVETISLPEGLQSIASEVFENCNSLKEVSLPSTLTSIGSGSFRGCTQLSSVSLNTGLVSIENSAFYGCSALETITIPSTVNRIGSNAFDYTGIKTFKCYAVVPPTATNSFIGNGMDMARTYLYVPPFSKDFYRNTQYWSNFYLMRSIEDQIDYILVDRELTINLEEEDNHVVANNPEINLTWGQSYNEWGDRNGNSIGQLTATGEGTLSAGQLTIDGLLASRYSNNYQYCPTLINYADKMRADNVTHNLSFNNYNGSGEWHFISLPYDVKVSDIVPSDNTYWAIRRYDSAARAAGETSSTWVNLTNDDTMEAGKGYIVSVYGGGYDENGYSIIPGLSFTSGNSLTKNNLFRPTDVIVPLNEYAAEFAHNRSWNLIGNPYPCYFDMHYLNEEFTAPITVWNGRSYVAYSPVDDDLVLSPYEAFFVQCPLDATEMTFKEAGRMHSNEGKTMYKSASRSFEVISVEDRNVFNFVLSDENYEDRTRIVLNPDALPEYEIGRDASKFFASTDENAQIYVNSDLAYSINERPVSDGTASIGIRSSKESLYTLSLTGKYSDEWHVMVTDNQTGITTDLTEEEYQFTAMNSDASRFSVRFTLDNNGQSGIDAIVSDFGADSKVTVTAINGTVVFNGRLAEIDVPTAGLYLISDGTKTRKAILK